MPHGGLAPGQNPNPTQSPGNLGGELPATTPNNAPGSSPNSIPGWQSAPTGQGQGNVQPVPLGSTGTASFSIPFIPAIGKANPTPDKNSPAPKNQDPTKPKTPTTPSTGGLSKEETQAAVCELTQPTSCLGKPLNRIEDKANQNNNKLDQNNNKLDQLNALLNGLDLAGIAALNSKLDVMNAKLGPQLPNGGLGGLLSRVWDKLNKVADWLKLDRILNILIWWQTLHNAYMLSNNLAQTLFSAISNVLAAIGIKDAEGNPIDVNAVFGGAIDELAKALIGVETWQGMKAEWKKWNRIYQAAANILNAVQSIGYSILSALEVVGSWVASIGNALRKWGEVGERAYRWMNPTPNFQNKFFTTLENVENVVSQVDTVASEVLSVQENINQIGEQKEQFTKALGEESGSKQGTESPEATQVKAAFDISKLVSATGLAITDEDKEADE
ncbi:hypothetical protein ACX27_14735 [Nostoc piscinale CENA21]|uniref:Uncharacterized protein n=1 Tax=Nostoc piscinale CENA21 TaxID=224013 RepID=A0A0M4TV66_9NOSO|nr:hypothetical protein [Nostoc piscinale]ALF53819.1 hypothetical protein ACX27_14735 [Nostoc piscinale CENA21]